MPELFGSPILDRVFRRLGEPIEAGTETLFALGILLLLLFAKKERGLGPNTTWTLSGIVCTVLVFVSAMVIWLGEPEYYAPPPGLAQYVRLGIVIALDVVVGIAIRQLIVAGNRPRISPSCE